MAARTARTREDSRRSRAERISHFRGESQKGASLDPDQHQDGPSRTARRLLESDAEDLRRRASASRSTARRRKSADNYVYLQKQRIEPSALLELAESHAASQRKLEEDATQESGPGAPTHDEIEKVMAHSDFAARLFPAQIRHLYGHALALGQTANVSIRRVNDVVGQGLFADETIPRGGFIGEYTGVIRSLPTARDRRGNDYLFIYYPHTPAPGREYLSDYFIDAKREGNALRFANHAEKSKANATDLHVFQDGTWHVLLVATRIISAGEQITFDYGSQYWEDRGDPSDLCAETTRCSDPLQPSDHPSRTSGTAAYFQPATR